METGAVMPFGVDLMVRIAPTDIVAFDTTSATTTYMGGDNVVSDD